MSNWISRISFGIAGLGSLALLKGLYGSNSEMKANGRIFLWGKGTYQARPDSAPKFANFYPKEKRMAMNSKGKEVVCPNLESIDVKGELGVGVDSEGRVWAFINPRMSARKSKGKENWVEREYTTDGALVMEKVHMDNILEGVMEIGGKEKARTVKIVGGNIYVLRQNGRVARIKLSAIGEPKWKEVKGVQDIVQMERGTNHMLILNKQGDVFGLGDDSHGECGSGVKGRFQSGPFILQTVHNPNKIASLEGQMIAKVFVGGQHNFALSESGQVYGWGFNNMMQLGHEEQFSAQDNPMLAIYAPMNFNSFFPNQKVLDIALGKDFSIFITENMLSKSIEVFGMGHNSQGQLGSGFTRHIQKFTKLEPLSDFTYKDVWGREVPLDLEVSCGENHCVAKGANGCLLTWGSNQFGQLGNKKRTFAGTPLFVSMFKESTVRKIQAVGDQTLVVIDQ